MSGINPLKKQAVIIERGSIRLVPFSEAQEAYKKSHGVARWLNEKFLVHRHDGEHSLIGEDGTCENCPNGGNCEPVKISAVNITAPLSRGIYKRTEMKTYRAEIRELISQLSPNHRREFKTFSPDEIESFSKMCNPIDEPYDVEVVALDELSAFKNGARRLKPMFKLPTPDEQALQAAYREEGEWKYLIPEKFAGPVGAPISRNRTLSAEQQKRAVNLAFDTILGKRKHRTT